MIYYWFAFYIFRKMLGVGSTEIKARCRSVGCNFLKLWLLVVLVFVDIASFAQPSKLTYDKFLECEELISNDTIQYYYENDDETPFYITFPVNSNVSFKTNLEDHTLNSASAEISNDSLIIYLTEQTFGLIINVKIYVIRDKPSVSITYWTAFGNDTRRFKPEKVILILKNKGIRKGDKLIGRVDVEFKGKLADPDPAALRDKKIRGQIEGCFNIRVDKILKSR